MQNPAYLTLSEHHIYHFRWAIPLHLLPDSKRRYVKLSLRTREPREALYLAKVMSYHADDITKQKWIRGMQHQQIRAIVHEYCQRFLDKKKQTILEGELLPPTELAGYQATIDNIATVVGLDDAGYRIDNDSEIAKMLTTMEVDVKHGSQDYERIRKAYMAAMPAVCAELITFNGEQSRFDFRPSNQQGGMVTHKLKPNSKGLRTLVKMADKYITAHVNDRAWDDNTKEDKKAKLAVLMEILGKDYLMSDMDLDKAREVRDIIKQLPKNINKNPLVRNLTLMDAIKVPNIDKIAVVTVRKYLNCYSDGDTVVNKIHFAVPNDIHQEVVEKAATKGLDVKVMAFDLSAHDAAQIVRDGFDNAAYWGLSNFFQQLAGGTLTAVALHTMVQAYLLHKGAVEAQGILREVGTKGVAAGGGIAAALGMESILKGVGVAAGSLPAVAIIMATALSVRGVVSRIISRQGHEEWLMCENKLIAKQLDNYSLANAQIPAAYCGAGSSENSGIELNNRYSYLN